MVMHDDLQMDGPFRTEIAAAVRAGRSIRAQVRNATAAAVQSTVDAEIGIAEIARAALQAAAAEVSASRDPADPLRQVVEGVADGLVVAAQALQLTVREAASRARMFARQDLDRVADEFGALATMFVDSVLLGLAAGGAQAEDLTQSIRDHAQAALRRAWPAFAAAASTARRDPLQLGIAAAESAGAVVHAAAGALRRELGEQLRKLGIAWSQPPHDAR